MAARAGSAVLALAVLLGGAREAAALEEYRRLTPNGYNVRVGGVGDVVAGYGHRALGGGGGRNSFGTLFAQEGLKWSKSLCEADSDGDGRSNGEELGDPACVWSPGAAPARTVNITHPGVADAVGTGDPSATVPAASIFDYMHGPLGFHIGLMFFSWFVLVPLATLPPLIYKKDRKAREWLPLHRNAMCAALLLSVVGLCLAVYYVAQSGAGHFASTHGKIGLVLIILAVLMGLSAFKRPPRNAVGFPKTFERKAWEWAHPMLGRGFVVLAVVNAYLGWNELGANLVPLYVFMGLLGLGVFFQLIYANFVREDPEADDNGSVGAPARVLVGTEASAAE
jgi:hypothetical protein